MQKSANSENSTRLFTPGESAWQRAAFVYSNARALMRVPVVLNSVCEAAWKLCGPSLTRARAGFVGRAGVLLFSRPSLDLKNCDTSG